MAYAIGYAIGALFGLALMVSGLDLLARARRFSFSLVFLGWCSIAATLVAAASRN
jgi:hypothetical protein